MKRKCSFNPTATAGGVLILGMVSLTVLAPFLAPFSPLEVDVTRRFLPPFHGQHFLGTDALGRDFWSRMLYGGRVAILVSSVSVAITMTVGTVLGMLAGYLGGWVDELISLVVNLFLGIPDLLLTLALVGIFPPGMGSLFLALNLFGWVGLTRIIRGEALFLRSSHFVEGAKVLGAGTGYILYRHILRNLVPTLTVWGSFRFGGFMIELATLGYIGMGIQPPFPDWGMMLSDARPYLLSYPHLFFLPAVAVTMVALGANLLGEGLRDMFDVRFVRSPLLR
ncbi:MAG: ABC transporter permease [Atribacterota bacterium]